MAYNDIKLRFGYFNVNLAKEEKRKKVTKNSKAVTGLVIKVDGVDKVGIRLTGDPMYADYLVLDFDEESLKTKDQDKVFYTDDKNHNTIVYKNDGVSFPPPYKVYGFNHLVKGIIKTLADGSHIFKFIEDLELLKRGEEAPVNNLK